MDCNLTHLIAASVLYWLGNEQIRGFAIPLWIGVATSMYTSVFVAHVIFDVAEKRRWIAKANMPAGSATRTSTSWAWPPIASPPRS